LVDKFQANKLPFWPNFQFPLDFELKIQETIQISNLLEFFAGVHTFGENSIISPKIFLAIILDTEI
jgi:hypothetical protein